MRHYEMLTILSAEMEEHGEEVSKIEEVVRNLGGNVAKTDVWGRRPLAYPIQKKSTGFYALLEFNAEPQVIEKLEVAYRRDERVLRFITVKNEKYAAKYAERRRNKKQTKED